jgi:acetylornithine/succinyldiaminopimelate/putrescine aminotransferase
MNTLQKDKKYLGRDIPALPLNIAGSEGSYLIDQRGIKYIDFLMGWNVGNIGWGVKEVKNKIKKFDGPDYVNPYYLYKPWADLAELLAKITPGRLVKTFRATGGTEAIEIALQAAMSHTKRTKFLSIDNSYHGHSIGAMSIGSDDFRKNYSNLLPNCFRIKPPLDLNAAREAEKILGKGDIAAFISEPIVCNLAVVIPKKEFFDIIQRACKKYGTVLIIDEVATGFGRTGKLFASEHFDLKPDIMCLGKALTGGYGTLAATIMTEEVAKSMEFDFSFYSTFGWQPLNVCASLANIGYFLKHKRQILNNVSKMSKYFETRFKKMKFRQPAEIRIKGLAIGLEFKKEGYNVEIVERCRKNKLLIDKMGPYALTIFPALTINEETSKKGLDIFEASL